MDEFMKIKAQHQHYFDDIRNIVMKFTENPEGDCMWYHGSLVESHELLAKQYNLYYLGSIYNNIMEIGFNAGHSALFMLLANASSKITIFDNCMHYYTYPCLDYLNKEFPGRIKIVKGDSTTTVKKYTTTNKFDLIHIDGNHDVNYVTQDFYNSLKLAKSNAIIILDDDNFPTLNRLHRDFIDTGLVEVYKNPKLMQTQLYTHLVCKVKNKKQINV